MENKLELKHLAPYLPYGLKVNFDSKGIFHDGIDNTNHKIGKISVDEWGDYVWILKDGEEFHAKGYSISFIKPILKPLSELTKDNINNEELLRVALVDGVIHGGTPYHEVDKLFKQHFDVFGLIPKGLAIDINHLKQ